MTRFCQTTTAPTGTSSCSKALMASCRANDPVLPNHDGTLYVTLEPCTMCAGALFWTQMGRVVYGASDEKRGFRSMGGQLHPKTKLSTGVEAELCGDLLTEFFRSKRKK